MRWLGGLVVLAYAASALTGVPDLGFGSGRSRLPADARRGPGGTWVWVGGFQGGK
jgi:hypothetical protein